MKTERQDFINDFEYFLKERVATNITVVEIKLNRKQWENQLTNSLINNLVNEGIDKTLGTSIVSKHKNKVWADLTKCVQTWEKRKRGNKRGYKAINNSRSHKYTKDYILIKLKGIPRKTSKTLKSGVKVKAGFPTPSWQEGAITNLKKEIKKKVKSFKIVTAEHGSLVQEEQGKGQVTSTGGRRNIAKKKGAVGNVVTNAIVQALKESVDRGDTYIDLFGDYVKAFWNVQYESRVNKNKSVDKFIANHRAKFVLLPAASLSNDGYYDKSDAEEFRNNYEVALRQFLKKKLGPKATEKDINKAYASSPNMTDEFKDYAASGATKKMLKAAGLRFTKTGALDKRFKGVKKDGGLDLRFKFNKELQETFNKTKTQKTSSNLSGTMSQEITRQKKVISKATGVAIGTGAKKQRQSQSPTQNTQALALKEIINLALPGAVLEKMQLPRLRNRTGRFKDSAEVVNTFYGPRGGLTIEYTYQKDPYQVFEPGVGRAPWANQYRDPKHIIGQSIREIVAANMKGMQPLLRRV